MKTCKIPHTDLTVSRIAYGCAMLGGWDQEPINANVISKAARTINTAYDSGITFFDHADLYSFGKSEEVFGRALKQSPGLREKITIQSKCGQYFSAGWRPGDPILVDLSREHIVRSVEGSLKRLGIEHLDILLLHIPDPLAQREEIAAAFDELHSSGKVRYFGLSNYIAAQIELLQKFVRQPLVANQIHLGLAHPHAIADGMEITMSVRSGSPKMLSSAYAGIVGSGTLDYCQLHNIQVQAWSPLRGDLLKPPADAAPEIKQTAQLLADLAKEKNATPSAVALAWLLRHPARIAPVIGASSLEHIVENCAADDIALSRQEWFALFASAAEIQRRVIE